MRSLIVIFLCVLSIRVTAQENRDDLTPLDIAYTTSVGNDKQTLRIGMSVDNIARPTLHLAMPDWTPGAYGIGRYGARVNDLAVTNGKGEALDVLRMDYKTWSVNTKGSKQIRATYTLKPGSRRGRRRSPAARAPTGEPTGLRISGPSTYVYVVGAKHLPVRSRYEIPNGWKIANGLLSTGDPAVRYARDYDTLIDAPTTLGIFQEHTFEVAGTPFSCVFFSNDQQYDFDIPAFVDVCKKIVKAQGELYGSYPFPNYVFLFSLPGGGGLEHLNSTTIGLNPVAMKRDVRAGASVTSHEFFHTWNVKRIRPKVLGPFEYEHENYTGNLWVSEGWTSYFGDLTMARTGIISRQEYLAKIERFIRVELNKEARKDHSVYWASRNVWQRNRADGLPRVDYYAKGEILGLAIDLKIRHVTGNKKSLNDVMRFFNRWFAERGVGFEEGDVERACTAVSNHDFGEFFARHVRGVLDPPLKECFAYAGIEYTENHLTASLPFSVRRRGGDRRVMRIRGETGSEIRSGDVIKAIDGEDRFDTTTFLAKRTAGDEVTVTYVRDGKEGEAKVRLLERRTMIPSLRFIENPTDEQRRIRESWLTENN